MPFEALPGLDEVSAQIRAGLLSPVALTRQLLERIERLEPRLHAFITVTAERALAQARERELELRRGSWRGPLHGVPLAVKDLIDTQDVPTTAGMAALRMRVPAHDATVIQRLEAAGAVILGKLAMTEGAYMTHHPQWPTPVNPYSAEHWTGVSSSGSGVATAAGLCFGALASDTGGSIRFPAAACGVTGLKPTWGRVSRHGVFPLAPTLDHVGVMARSALDAAILFQVIAGHDRADPTTLAAPVPDYRSLLGLGVAGLRLGVDEHLLSDRIDGEIARAADAARRTLEARGARCVAVRVPPLECCGDIFAAILPCEAALAHRSTFAQHGAGYGADLASLVTHGAGIDGVTLAQAHIDRRRFCGALNALFEDIDLLLLPAMPVPTPRLAQLAAIADDPSTGLAHFTMPFNLSGHPTITFPAGTDGNGLPLGLQLAGRHLQEDLLLRAAHALQQQPAFGVRGVALG